MTMKLYTVALSPNCRRVEATLHRLGYAADTEFEVLDFTSGVLQSPNYAKINPNGKVPVLIHDGTTFWESIAIMHYLAGVSGDEAFSPADNVARAEVIKWQLWETVHFNRAVGGLCWETIAKPSMGIGQPDEDIIDQAVQSFHRFAKVLDAHLEGRRFILGGDQPSIADYSVGSHSAMILHPQSRVPLDDYSNLKAWCHALEADPHWAKTAPH